MSKKTIVPILALFLLLIFALTLIYYFGNSSPGESTPVSWETAGDSQVYITEFMTSNRYVFSDEDGDYRDWIEIYNSGDTPVNLKGYYLSDNKKKLEKWQFPRKIIEPGQYLIVFASGKDKNDPEGEYLHTNFRLTRDGDNIIFSQKDGKIIDNIEITLMSSNISYGRNKDNKDIWQYFIKPTPGDANSTLGYSELPLDQVVKEPNVYINEIMASNKNILEDEDMDFPDWIELYNPTNNEINLYGYSLSDNETNPFKWQIPEITLQPGEYRIIFASSKNRRDPAGENLHTDFNINRTNDEIFLRDPEGRLIDHIIIDSHLPDVSYGRSLENKDIWLFYPQPTPGEENHTYGFQSLDVAKEEGNLFITEVMGLNTITLKDNGGEYPDWIEIFNKSDSVIELSGFGLSDNKNNPHKWVFPDIQIKPKEYLVVYASKENKVDTENRILHTNFTISSSGETIILSDDFGNIIDSIRAGPMPADISYGRELETGQWLYYKEPTPGKENSTIGFIGLSKAPVFDLAGGFYKDNVLLSINKDDSDTLIRYTLDGSNPTKKSALYSQPIKIENTTVVRASAFKKDHLTVATTTQTYFINVEHSLPVVSVTIDPRDFDDPIHGIHSTGPNASDEFPYVGANYHKDIEKPAHFEFYESNGQLGYRLNSGFKIFGGYTRAYSQKSFAIYARNRYEKNEMTYPFLENKPLLNYKHLVLRTSGQDVFRTKIRDIMMTSMIQDTGLDYQGYRQVILYINGKYWGIYNIREKINRYFIHYNHGIEDLDSIDILEANRRVKAGNNDEYLEMIKFVTEKDMSIKENYNYIKTQMDVQNYMDYQILQMYIANNDNGNIRFWRERAEGSKWKWIAFDMDMGFQGVQYDSVWHVLNPAGTGHGNFFSNILIRKLLENNEFRSEFIERFAWHLENTFDPERVIAIIDQLAANIEPEIPMNLDRWPRPQSLDYWQREVQDLRFFANRRPAIIIGHLKNHLNLTDKEMELFKKP